jgi:predicted ATP-binding protein involved in virulence
VREANFPLNVIEGFVPDLQRIGPQSWRSRTTDETLTFQEVLENHEVELAEVLKHLTKQPGIPDWLKTLTTELEVRVIGTERLTAERRLTNHRSEGNARSKIPAVKVYAKDLASKIQEKLAEYAALSQSLDRTFPVRLVNQAEVGYSLKELKESLELLEEKRLKLVSAGLLEKESDDTNLGKSNIQIEEKNISVLSVYVKDNVQKMSVFSDLVSRIELFKGMINERFLYKSLSINKSQGFVFITDNNRIIDSTNLSSGEQHELVLLYELLFIVAPNTLILIDEPEISLHVGWQELFLRDLARILEKANFEVLLATHSPQIINDKWDLTIELVNETND